MISIAWFNQLIYLPRIEIGINSVTIDIRIIPNYISLIISKLNSYPSCVLIVSSSVSNIFINSVRIWVPTTKIIRVLTFWIFRRSISVEIRPVTSVNHVFSDNCSIVVSPCDFVLSISGIKAWINICITIAFYVIPARECIVIICIRFSGWCFAVIL